MKKYIEIQTLFGHNDVVGFGTDDFYVKEIDRKTSNNIIIKNHYSGKVCMSTYIHLGVFINNEILGVLQFGHAMNPASCKNIVRNTLSDEYLELNRMWLDDRAERNSESKSIAYSIKYIKRRYPKIKWIQSFADERCGKNGIVYQAANFKYFGEHKNIFWTLNGVVYHNKCMTIKNGATPKEKNLQANKQNATSETLRQFRYLYFIDKRCENDVLLKQQKFNKHYAENANS